MRRKSTTPRLPATDGPDVLYNGGDWDLYLDGRYLGSRDNYAAALADARRAWADALAAARYDHADAYAAHCEAAALAS